MKRVIGAFRWIGLVFLLVAGLGEEAKGDLTLGNSLSVSQSYNDNFFFTEENKEADYATVIAPELTLTYNSRNLTFFGRYQGSLGFRAENREENRYSQSSSFDLDLPLFSRIVKGFDIKITEEIIYAPELPSYSFDDKTQMTNEGIQVPRNDTVGNRAGLTVSYVWSRQISMALSYTNGVTLYKSPEFQDRVAHDADFQVGYQSSAMTRWTASYGIGITDFQGDKRFITHRYMVGARHQVDPSFSIDGEVGIVSFEVEPDEQSARVAAMSANISKGYRSGSLSLRYVRETGSGGGLTPSITLTQRVVGRATRTFGSASLYAQAAYGRNASLPLKELKISSYEGGAGVELKLLDWLHGSLSYSYFNQQAQGDIGTDGERNLVTIMLTASGPAWRIVRSE